MAKKSEKRKEKKEISEGNQLFNTIESIEVGSNKSINWSFSIIGGSLLVILNEGYIQPHCQDYKLVYLLFGVGWTLIGISIYYGRKIANSKMAAVLFRQDNGSLKNILKNVNRYYTNQLILFNWSLVFFGLWLILYLIWWVFGYKM
ncbi:MAG: hypothetical protein AAF348_19435 [Bacteroidota bacterium]